MRRPHLLLLVPALLLAACGGDDAEPAAATSSSSPASTTATPSGSASATASTDAASVAFADQSGDGATAVVDRVVIPQGGFVVVSVHDDGAVLGSVAVPAGTAQSVQVPLQPPITQDTELDATLYLDTDGNGAFDAAVDHAVPVPDQSRDRDRTDDHDGDPDQDQDQDRDQDLSHDVVSDDAHYRVT